MSAGFIAYSTRQRKRQSQLSSAAVKHSGHSRCVLPLTRNCSESVSRRNSVTCGHTVVLNVLAMPSFKLLGMYGSLVRRASSRLPAAAIDRSSTPALALLTRPRRGTCRPSVPCLWSPVWCSSTLSVGDGLVGDNGISDRGRLYTTGPRQTAPSDGASSTYHRRTIPFCNDTMACGSLRE
eukprot:scaffold15780_cov68-Phaeocystis_antarctica.AAC.6